MPTAMTMSAFIAFFSMLMAFYTNPDVRALEKLRRSISYVHTATWHGTGFVVEARSGRKLVATNAHVCDSLQQDLANKIDDHVSQEVVLELNVAADSCLITLKDQSRPALKLSDYPNLASNVYVVGFPGQDPLLLHRGKLVDRYTIDTGVMRFSMITTVHIRGGNSGSPLLNEQDEVVGIIYAGSSQYSAALPLDWIKRTLLKY